MERRVKGLFKLESDFTDYYDYLCDDTSSVVYHRDRKNISRIDDLNFLKSLGIKTVKIGPFKQFDPSFEKLVVYTDPYLHDCLGKHIYTFDDVSLQYRANLVAEFIQGSNGYTFKYLQIGERRFKITLYNPDYQTVLSEGRLVNFEELPKQYNYSIGLPIYSIDYVPTNFGMIAVDFNRVQSLIKIDIDKYLSAEEVLVEIKKALLTYNII